MKKLNQYLKKKNNISMTQKRTILFIHIIHYFLFRLEWHKTITDGLKEYCTLIDSSSSFRAYRQALAETQPPCIPYM